MTLDDWYHLRNIVRKICGSWIVKEDVDDVASEALLIQLNRKTHSYYAVVSALRSRFGRVGSKRWKVRNPIELETELTAPEDENLELARADDLAGRLALGSPPWVEKAMCLLARDYTLKEAAHLCDRSYEALYLHLKR